MFYVGYILKDYKEVVELLLPEKPTGYDVVRLPLNGKKVTTSDLQMYEPYAFDLTIVDNEIVDWVRKPVKEVCEEKIFVALLSDGRVLADDGKSYKVFNSKRLNKGTDNQITEIMQYLDMDSNNRIKMWVKDGIIYSMEKCSSPFVDSWFHEDAMATYLNSFSRYKVQNMSKAREELFKAAGAAMVN